MVNGPATEPRSTFDCLWCGRAWTVRTPDDLEGYARLCPDCLGKGGDNPFLRYRLRSALEARAGAGATRRPEQVAAVPDGDQGPAMIEYYAARAAEYDDWYLRRGRYERGPIHDAAWNAELDTAGGWLDRLPLGGRIVELAAGTGWWSPLLASKGELWLYDAAEPPLERARERLVAHGLRAHIHVRDAWAAPEGKPADGLFAGFWLSHVERARTVEFLAVARAWLRPGGRLALIDSLPDPQSGASDHPAPSGDLAVRRLGDGREFTIVKVYRSVEEIATALAAAGFAAVEVTTTGRFFVLVTATARP
ncbi:MAG TPA: class I SAM-dependent methyltransferase [Candidatus Bathyarchaeia archaeon]|nr:class I SAM-dependent methyltransferase [Candidatus Bathyarchaeia archaeon]